MNPDLIVIVITLLFSAFCSGIEIAFISSNRLRIELEKNKGTLNGKILGFFYKFEEHFIATLLLGNNIALVLYGISIAKILSPTLISWGLESDGLIFVFQIVISTFIVLVTAEFLPKAIFQLNPNRLLKTLAIPMFVVYFALYIPTTFILWLSLGFLKILNVEISNSEKVFSKIDLEHYVYDLNQRINEEENLGNEMQILQNALDFSKIKARDCMVPRPEIIAVDITDEISKLHDLFVKTGISKVLIFRDSIDNIIGYVHAFELFNKPKAINQVMRSISFVPEALPGKELLELFTKKSISIAVVVDEYGGTAGVVTIEDVIEEIFGDIEDEHDKEDWLEEKINESEYRFSARVDIDYLNEKYKFKFEESDEYDTLGGLIIHHLESIPEANSELIVEDYKFIIEKVSDRRIEVVKIELL
jgi:putative hemolysin